MKCQIKKYNLLKFGAEDLEKEITEALNESDGEVLALDLERINATDLWLFIISKGGNRKWQNKNA